MFSGRSLWYNFTINQENTIMGYGINTTAFWGVVLSWDDTQKLMTAIQNSFAANGLSATNSSYPWGMRGKDFLDALIVHLDPAVAGRNASNVVMMADDSDSRTGSTSYQEDHEHGVGFMISEKGYGSRTTSHDFAAAMTNSTAKQASDFDRLIQPLLDAAGIKEVPCLNVVGCTL